MEVIDQDLLAVSKGVIGHQVNCQGVMGAGLALAVRKKYPRVFHSYKGYLDSLPVLQERQALGMIQPVKVGEGLFVFNLFGQLSYGRNGQETSYEALEAIAQKLKQRNIQIHLPFGMGCGLGGGDWDTVQGIFKEVDGWWCRLDILTDLKER